MLVSEETGAVQAIVYMLFMLVRLSIPGVRGRHVVYANEKRYQ